MTLKRFLLTLTALALAVRAASFGGAYVPPVVSRARRDYDRRAA